MAQMGFFDLSDRYASLDAKKDPLMEIDAVVPWEEFRPLLEQVWRKPESERKSNAGRKPVDAVVMFKALVLGALYNLSDDQVEYQIRDRLSFMRFLGLGLGDRVPDAKTVWFYREALVQAGKVEELFKLFDRHLARQGYIARGGQILDASIVPVPRNHNTRKENAAIKDGKEPPSRACKHALPGNGGLGAQARQAIAERYGRPPLGHSGNAREGKGWTKKHGKSHYGYKNHVNVDRKHKLIRRYHVSDAALHPSHGLQGQTAPQGAGRAVDSQAVDKLLMRGNTASGVWADSAYRSEDIEAKLRARGLTSRIHRKGKTPLSGILQMPCRSMSKPLTEQAMKSNRTKYSVRVRPSRACKGMPCRAMVEHVFGAQANDMGSSLVRTIGLVRAKAKIGMKNLAYNIRRLGQLRRLNPFPA